MFGLPSWLLIVPVLGSLVLIHEFGHFATAKLLGIKVTEFGLGWPPRIFGIPFRGTLYSINWLLPLGGFVRLAGEEDPTHPDSFAAQSVAKRSAVLAAGSVMNLVLPVVIITVMLMLPHDAFVGGDVLVTAVAPGSPAADARLRPGDTILTVDGRRVMMPSDLVDAIQDRLGRPVELGLKRAPIVSGLGFSPDLTTFETVTLVPRRDPPRLEIVETVTDPDTQVSLADARRYERELKIGDYMPQGAIGVRIGLVNPKVDQVTEPIWEAFPGSFVTMWDFLVLNWNGIVDGVTTRSNPGFAGPIGIAQVTGEVVDRFGFSRVFQITAVLSIMLGIVNILPLPPLDGGKLLFVLIEWVRRGKRISPQREGLVHLVGFAIVIGLVIVISYADIMRLVNGESLLR